MKTIVVSFTRNLLLGFLALFSLLFLFTSLAAGPIIPNTGHELMFNKPDEILRAMDLAWQMANGK